MSDAILTLEQWLKLGFFVRWWRVLFCAHPFEKSIKIGAIRDPSNISPINKPERFEYVINVRRCKVCRQYFIDDGYQYIE